MMASSPRKVPKGSKRILPTLPLESPRLKVVTFNDETTETSIGGTQRVGKIKKDVILHFEKSHLANGSSKPPRRGGLTNTPKLGQTLDALQKDSKTVISSSSSHLSATAANSQENKENKTQHLGSSSGSESESYSQFDPPPPIDKDYQLKDVPSNVFRTPTASSQQPRRHTLESKLFGTPDCYRNVNLETPRRMLPTVHDESVDDGEDSCSIMVAVRVRPFAQREMLDSSNQCAVFMEGNQTIVRVDGGPEHRFAYDYSFWSHDKQHGEFSDQESVYKRLGQPLLGKAFEGYNTCLFAYGQTGSGKSYSIMGHGKDFGIVPRFCAELFSRAEVLKDRKKVKVNVEISFYEIYNEKIHDLLATTNKEKGAKKSSLKVREHPQLGPYVEGLSNFVVNSFDDVEGWLNLGNKNRATATTAMNDKSSRSHSILTIILTQTKTESIEGHEHDHNITSKINLVDLAGSERQSFANTSGERLREGANINKSLLTLGKVISLLAEKSASSKKRKMFIPYRDSVLTWLLKESLGGNSKTAMMATISPSNIHLEETLSTLRYAQQARSIVNMVRVNEDPKARIIRQLRMEIEKLRGEQGGGVLNEEALAVSVAEVTRLKSEMEELSRSWQERLRQAETKKAEELQLLERSGITFKVDNRHPNLVNLNEDPQLSEMLLYVIKEGETRVGRKLHSSRHDIQLTGALIADNHCVIKNDGRMVNITPIKDAPTYVNGNLVSERTTLHHGDRVILGGDHFFRFNHPMEVKKNKSEGKGINTEIKDFDYAKQELHSVQEERLQAELEIELERTKQELTEQKDGYETKLKGLETELTTVEQTHKEAQSTIHTLKKKNMMLEQEVLAGRKRQQMESTLYQQALDELPNRKSRIVELLESERRQMKEDLESLRLRRSQLTATQEVTSKSTKSSTLPHGIGSQLTNSPSSSLGGRDLYRMALLLREANKINQYLNTNLVFCREDTSDETTGSVGRTQIRVINTRHKMSTLWSVARFEDSLEQMRDIYNNEGDASACDDDVFNDLEDVWEKDTSSFTLSASSPALSNSLNGVWRSPTGIKRSTPNSARRGMSNGATSPRQEHANVMSVFRNMFSMTGDDFSELTLKESIADKILMVCQRITDNTSFIIKHTSNSQGASTEGTNHSSSCLSTIFQLATDVQVVTSLTSSICSSLSLSSSPSNQKGEFLMDLMTRLREAIKTLHHKGNSLLQGCEGRITSLVNESGQKMTDTVSSLALTIGEMSMALGLHLVRLDHSEAGQLSCNIKQAFLSGASRFVLQSLEGGKTSLELLESKCERLQEMSLKQEDATCGEMCRRINHILNCTKSFLEKTSDVQKRVESHHHQRRTRRREILEEGEHDDNGNDADDEEEDSPPPHYHITSYKQFQGIVAQTSTITDSCALLVQAVQAVVLGGTGDGKRLEKCARLVLSGCQRLLSISSSWSNHGLSTMSASSLTTTTVSPHRQQKPRHSSSHQQSNSSVKSTSTTSSCMSITRDDNLNIPILLSDFSSVSSTFSSISSLPSSCNETTIDKEVINNNRNNSNRRNSNSNGEDKNNSDVSSTSTTVDEDQFDEYKQADKMAVLLQPSMEFLADAGQEVTMATVMFEEFVQKKYGIVHSVSQSGTSDRDSERRANYDNANRGSVSRMTNVSTTPRGQRMLPASPKHKIVTMAGKEALFKKRERVAGLALVELGIKKVIKDGNDAMLSQDGQEGGQNL